ncbi:MAG: 30S ribosomal protein S6 [Candidatus Binatia bacterium]
MAEIVNSYRYETVFVLHPEQAPRAKEFIERFRKIVEGLGGVMAYMEEWGIRELAYRIQKQNKGYYTLLQYTAPPKAVAELDRNLKISEGVIRHLTVRVEEDSASKPGPEDRGPRRSVERESAKPEP